MAAAVPVSLENDELVSVENSDLLATSDPAVLLYRLTVFNNGFDGFNFRVGGGSNPICFNPHPDSPDTCLGNTRLILDIKLFALTKQIFASPLMHGTCSVTGRRRLPETASATGLSTTGFNARLTKVFLLVISQCTIN